MRQLERDRKVGPQAAVIGVRQHPVGAQGDVAVVLGDRVGGERAVRGIGRDAGGPCAQVVARTHIGKLGPADGGDIGIGPELETGPSEGRAAAECFLTGAPGRAVEVALIPRARRGGVGFRQVDLGLDAFVARPPGVAAEGDVVRFDSGQGERRDLHAVIDLGVAGDRAVREEGDGPHRGAARRRRAAEQLVHRAGFAGLEQPVRGHVRHGQARARIGRD